MNHIISNSKGDINLLLLMIFLLLGLLFVFSLKKIIVYSEHHFFETQTICLSNYIEKKKKLNHDFRIINKAIHLLNVGEALNVVAIPLPPSVLNTKMAKSYLINLRQTLFTKFLASLTLQNKKKCKFPIAFNLSPYQHAYGKLKLDSSSQPIREKKIHFSIQGFNQEFKFYSNNLKSESNEITYKQL